MSKVKTIVKQLRVILDEGQVDYIKLINAAENKAKADFEKAKESYTASINQIEGIKSGVRFEAMRRVGVEITSVQSLNPIGEFEFDVVYNAPVLPEPVVVSPVIEETPVIDVPAEILIVDELGQTSLPVK